MTPHNPKEEIRRIRLVLGSDCEDKKEQEGQGQGQEGQSQEDQDKILDELLNQLYDGKPLNEEPMVGGRRGGYSSSRPDIARFLGDIGDYFPQPVIEVIQKDVINNFGLDVLLDDPELASKIEPSLELVTTIMSLRDALPENTRESARLVIGKLVEDLMKRLKHSFEQAFRRGKIDYDNRSPKPKFKDVRLIKTLLANLDSYDEELGSLTELRKLIAYARSKNSAQDLILVIDRSGSMSESIVYTSIYTALLSAIPSIRTRVLVFDTEIVDLSELVNDPVEFLFAINLGGGTDIERALHHAQDMVQDPSNTALVLISDLYEGGNETRLLNRVRSIIDQQVNFICVTALSDTGQGAYDVPMAESFSELGAPTFACTPEAFPEIMAQALNGKDISHLIQKEG